ncbi:MAG TPA: diguanylate cyclase [Candidatus Omnitrophota bacterium]|nr:diguanylate cyclase [Candidatus Omnitrophota bacterium]
MERVKRILIISSDKTLRDVLMFCFDGWGYEVFLQDVPGNDVNQIKRISPDVIVVDVQTARKPQLEICQLLKDDFLTAFIPIITIINKRQLRQQLLDIRQGVDDYLIKPPDPLDLRIRIEMALKRSQYSYHTNTLTGLPGARIIEECVRDKIHQGKPFSFGYVDIDNFKFFNDAYGYHKGDKAIMQVAYMLYTVIKEAGNPEDFIGHIGGDDFVFVTTPEKYAAICRSFIEQFDTLMPFHYSAEDRDQGFVMARDRTHKVRKLPLMSLSIAVVNCSESQPFKSLVEVSDRVAEIKGYLKAQPGSKFMADRRSGDAVNGAEPQSAGPAPAEKRSRTHRPLGQILIERKCITVEQLDEALRVNWHRGVALGEILKECGYIKDPDLQSALEAQKALSAPGGEIVPRPQMLN